MLKLFAALPLMLNRSTCGINSTMYSNVLQNITCL